MNLPHYNTPLFRLLLAFIVGSIIAKAITTITPLAAVIAASGVIVVMALLHRNGNYQLRWLQGLCLCLIAFVVGATFMSLAIQRNQYDFPAQSVVYKSRLLQEPERKAKSFACKCEVLGYYADSGYVEVNKRAIVYLAYDNADSALLQTGRVVLTQATLAAPHNNGNPEEFDYENYLMVKGISATGYSPHWRATDVVLNDEDLTAKALSFRRSLQALYREYGFTTEEDYGVLSAITLGDNESLDEDTGAAYRQAGVAHVLVVSGLHVWLVSAVVSLLLCVLFPYRLFYTKKILCVVFIWGFTLMTGAMPSVLRASLAISALVLTQLLAYRSHPINTLCLVCLVLLTANPLFLFDVGFQLSFSAVLGILLWYKWMCGLWQPENRILRYLRDLIAVSLCAQLGVLPLVIYYFSAFPTYFLVGNILVVALANVVVGTSMLFLFVAAWCQAAGDVVAAILRTEVSLMNGIADAISLLPFASINNLYVPYWEAIAITLFIIASMNTLRRFFNKERVRYRSLLISLSLLFICEAVKTLYFRVTPDALYFYNIPTTAAVQIFETDKKSFVWVQNGTDTTMLKRTLQPYWNRIRQQPTIFATSHEQSLLHACGQTIYRVSSNEQIYQMQTSVVPDYLWIVKGYTRSISEIKLPVKNVIIDGSLSDFYRKRLIAECKAINVPTIDLKERGAVLITSTRQVYRP